MKADLNQFKFVDKTVRQIADWLEKETGFEFTLTSIYRIGDPGVHGQLPVRGIDLRNRHYYIGKVLEQLINDNWTYDPERPSLKCALLHGEGSNLHIHIQAHPNTVRI